MEFLVRAEKGGTRRFFHHASTQDNVLGSCEAASPSVKQERTVFIDGPYGLHRPLRQFGSVILLTGGVEVTFIMPCLRDIVAGWKQEAQQQSTGKRHTVTKRVRFVWVIKSYTQLSWFEEQLQSVLEDVAECRRLQPDIPIEIDMTTHITCNETLEGPVAICSQTHTRGLYSPVPLTDVDERGPTALNNGVTVQPVPSSSSSNQQRQAQEGSLPSGCCCMSHVRDENETISKKSLCICSEHTPAATTSTQTQSVEKSPSNSTSTISGRPQPRAIIRKVLEKAEGESAVAVCGPKGLSDDVRRSVVALSDERAVHKGTGAQGIYLHVEGFGW